MAVVDITHYRDLARASVGGAVQTGQEPALSTQQVSITAGSVQSAAFPSGTKMVRVHTDGAVRVAFGANPTAAATTMRLAAGQTEYFGVMEGHKVAVIQTT
jgi:GMP synthase-like glutamine amidotransferase